MCCKDKDCFWVTLISNIVIASGIAGAFFAGILPSVLLLIFATLGLGVLIILIAIFRSICKKCIKQDEKCFTLVGIGAIIISVVALLAPVLVTGAESVALLIGAVAFFFIWSLLELIKLVFSSERCKID